MLSIAEADFVRSTSLQPVALRLLAGRLTDASAGSRPVVGCTPCAS
jgi:hypothetical protein